MNSLLYASAILFFMNGITTQISGQDLDSLLNQKFNTAETTEPAIFRSPTIVNSHSVNMLPPGTLDFRIEHRFGELNGGIYELFGLDNANIHFSFEYGIAHWLMIGAGRGTYEKTYDGFIRIKPLTQKSGAETFPFSLAFQSSIYVNTLSFLADLNGYPFTHRPAHPHPVTLAPNSLTPRRAPQQQEQQWQTKACPSCTL